MQTFGAHEGGRGANAPRAPPWLQACSLQCIDVGHSVISSGFWNSTSEETKKASPMVDWRLSPNGYSPKVRENTSLD